ncbi:MAG: hypothetical protein P1U77_18610, partial [Rubripirellula sp.]|nr:hypothetical protein [Rubripirellula sp.]
TGPNQTGPNQTGPNQTGPNQTGTYQFLEKNPTSTANPEATASTPGAASTIRAAVNQPNTIVPPQGITYPIVSQPAFLASQSAPLGEVTAIGGDDRLTRHSGSVTAGQQPLNIWAATTKLRP